jgi:predicted DNA-binding transcriptional regulator AlpA
MREKPSQLPATLPEPLTSKPILTVDEVAALLQVERRQVQRLGVPALKLGHKTVRYSARAVARWLETQATAA